jgi:hypothetical protein
VRKEIAIHRFNTAKIGVNIRKGGMDMADSDVIEEPQHKQRFVWVKDNVVN